MNYQPPVIIKESELEDFRHSHGDITHVDIYDVQRSELERIHNPSGRPIEGAAVKPSEQYIFYPWRRTLLHCVGPDELFILRTNRNKNLITDEEQEILANSVVGVAGMSVGAGIAIGLAYSGISSTIKLADNDELDTSNLNRLRESLLSIGTPKVHLAARHIAEVNPRAVIELFSDGITADNIESFFSDPALSVVVDEIDDFKMKVQLRVHARAARIPLIMFTSLGDHILIDVERYDQNPEMPLFHGLLPDVSEEILANPDISIEDIRRYSVQLVGQEYIPTRALQSLTEMGKTLVGRPQLYSTIAVDGGLASFVIRKILLEQGLSSGRYFVNFNELLETGSNDLSSEDPERQVILERLFNRGA